MDENAAYSVGLTDEARRNLEGIFRYVAQNLLEPGTAASLYAKRPALAGRFHFNEKEKCPKALHDNGERATYYLSFRGGKK